MATITKRDIVSHLVETLDKPSQVEVAQMVQETIDFVIACLARGDNIALRKFGSFQVRVTPPKVGRNPKRPDSTVEIPSRAVVKFKPGKELKQKVAKVLPSLQSKKSSASRRKAPAKKSSARR